MENLNLHSCYIGNYGLQIGHTNNNQKGTIRINKHNTILEYSDGNEWINCIKNGTRHDNIIYCANELNRLDSDSIIFGTNENINTSIILGNNNKGNDNIVLGHNTKSTNDTLLIGNNISNLCSNSLCIGNNTINNGEIGITISSNSSIQHSVKNIIIGNDNSITNTSNSIYISSKIYTSNSIGDTYLGYQVGYHPPNISILSENESESELLYDSELDVLQPIEKTNNSIIGYNSGYQLSGFENTIIGCSAGYRVKNNNVYIGYQSGLSISNSESYNCVIGSHNNFHDSYSKNIFIGFNSGLNSKNDNILIGYETGNNGINNINIGFKSGNINNKDNNIFIGHKSGEISYGKNTTSIGTLSSQYSHGCNSNLGYNTGLLLIDNNICVGANSAISNDGINNTFVGYNVGNQNSNDNIIIGSNSGNLLKGDKNILIGYNCGDENISNISKSIYIGNYSGNNLDGDLIISNNYNNCLLNLNDNVLDINGSLNINNINIQDDKDILVIKSKTTVDGVSINNSTMSVSNIKFNTLKYINNYNYDMSNGDNIIIIQYPKCTINLPTITEDIMGKFFYIKQLNSVTSTVYSSENQTINGMDNYKFKSQNTCILLIPIDSANWHVTSLFNGDDDIRYSNILHL